MSHVFISYSSKNRDYANKLADKLRREGFEVWIDARIQSGDDWWKSIMSALRSCAAFIVLMTPDSEGSDWVQREVTIADSLKKPAFPLLLDGSGNLLDSDYWSIYVRTQYEDVRHAELPEPDFFERLREAIDASILASEPMNITSSMPAITIRGFGLKGGGLPDIDWVEIPQGNFIYGEGEEQTQISLPEFHMSRFPITYWQFGAFIKNDGYNNRTYWTEQGWNWKQKHHVLAPLLWDAVEWHVADHPVVLITWFEAVAFCKWLSKAVGFSVRLPTEQQWEKAARGPDGLTYPWGNTYQKGIANINDTYFPGYRADPVMLRLAKPVYDSSSPSPYGVRDMSGNVWEWCRVGNTDVDEAAIEPHSNQPLRGGSWYFNYEYATTTYTLLQTAETRRYEGGFRVVCERPQ